MQGKPVAALGVPRYRFTRTERGEPCAWAVAEDPDAEAWMLTCYSGCEKRCRRKYDLGWVERAEARRNGPRVFPKPKGGERGKFGFCQWCGDPVMHHEGKRAGEQNMRRGWHDGRGPEEDCLYAFYLHTRPDQQRRFVARRDGERCRDCGGEPWKWLRGAIVTVGSYPWPVGVPMPTYQEVTRVSALELEHEVPLWKIQHLPDDERSVYFSPVNLRLRCGTCHGAKTKREAAERAAARRLDRQTPP